MKQHPAWLSPLAAIRLRLAAANQTEPRRLAAFAIIDALQHYPPEVQMDGLFAAATAMSQTLNLDPHEMVARARRVLPDLEAGYTMHLEAVRDYARGELTR